jgi:hypothetical protein
MSQLIVTQSGIKNILMKNLLLLSILFSAFVSCKKETIDTPVEEVPIRVTNAVAVTDTVNYPPSVSNVKTNATQLNYGKIKVVKSMNLLLNSIAPDIMANSSIHIYLKLGGNYYHLPNSTPAGIAYNYTLRAAFPYCNVTVTRSAGAAEVFEDVIIVAAKNSYLLTMTPTLNFTNYSNVKLKLGL